MSLFTMIKNKEFMSSPVQRVPNIQENASHDIQRPLFAVLKNSEKYVKVSGMPAPIPQQNSSN